MTHHTKALFSILLILPLACNVTDQSRLRPTETHAPIPTRTPSPTSTATPTPSPLPPTTTPVPFPDWVTEFSDPLLARIADRRPDFQDDFTQFNRGWYFYEAGARIGPYYARLQDGALLLQLPEGRERKDLMVFNSQLARRDFVLSFDFKFGKTEPDDILRFRFDGAPDRSVILDLSKNEEWILAWSLRNDRETSTGTYDYFSPEWTQVVVLMRGTECAVLLNQDPLAYLRDCRTGSSLASDPTAVAFHLLSIPGREASVTIDNVKFWDLTP